MLRKTVKNLPSIVIGAPTDHVDGCPHSERFKDVWREWTLVERKWPAEAGGASLDGSLPRRRRQCVLGACELYRPRGGRRYDDRGISLGSLHRLSVPLGGERKPTSLFMIRFYSSLIVDGDPALALALTKWNFAHAGGSGDGVRVMRLNDIFGADIEEFRNPLYWAAFVFSLGVNRQSTEWIV
jgi:hypothetical protein